MSSLAAPTQSDSRNDRPTIPVPADRRRVKYDSLLPPILADIADALDALTSKRAPSRSARAQ